MIEQRQRGIANRVDEHAVVREVDAVAAPAAGDRVPERPPRGIVHPRKQRVADRPGDAAGRVDRARGSSRRWRHPHRCRSSLRRGLAPFGRPEDFEVRVLRRDERQRAVVEQQNVDDDGADRLGRRSGCGAHADLAVGVQHRPLFRTEWRGLAEHVPLAARGRLRRLPGCGVFRIVQREAADERARAIVELDRRRQPRAGERRLLPDEERTLRRWLRGGRRPGLRSPAPASTAIRSISRRASDRWSWSVCCCRCACTANRVAISERIARSA